MPGQPDENLPIEVGETIINSGKKTEAQVTLHGMLHDFSEEDQAIFDGSIVAAYNEAFTKTGYTLGSFESVTDIDMPVGWMPDCRL
jgi:hypothetical protein